MARSRLLAAVAVVLLLAAACGDDDDTVSSVASDGASRGTPLEGTTWVLSADAPLGVALEAIAVTAQFQHGRLSGHSGCNRYTTSYTLDGDSLSIGPDIGGTSTACPPAQMAVEQAYLGRLPQATGFVIDGNTLTLTDDQDKTILRYEATEGSEAIQGDWEVTSYYAGNAITSVLGGVTMTAKFEDGTVSGDTGCNSFNGPYEIDGQNITIGPLASTLAACPTPELSTQETNYLDALQLAQTFQVTGDQLDLFREGGTYAVSFVSG